MVVSRRRICRISQSPFMAGNIAELRSALLALRTLILMHRLGTSLMWSTKGSGCMAALDVCSRYSKAQWTCQILPACQFGLGLQAEIQGATLAMSLGCCSVSFIRQVLV